jgi:sugar lactone lactonase YvrE
MRRQLWTIAVGAVGLGALVGGCAMKDDSAGAMAPRNGESDTSNGYPSVTDDEGTGDSATVDGSGPLPPEQEIESSFEAPVVTGKYLWSANPTSGRVALVDAQTLSVTTVESGFGPRYLAPVPTGDADEVQTIVLNVLGEDATLLTLAGGRLEDPVRIPTHADANALAVSPSGRWVVAWSDWHRAEVLDPMDSFQDLTLILAHPASGAPRSSRRHAGYRPSSVTFDAAEERLLVVSEHGVTVIDLSDEDDPQVLPLVEVAPGGLADAAARDVVVTPDGALAVVRTDGSATLGFVDLESGEITEVTLGGPVTDVDLDADGSHAVAVQRDAGLVSVLELPAALTDPDRISTLAVEATLGSVSLSPDGSVGVLYTNATPTSVVATVDLTGDELLVPRYEDLRAPVRGVLVAPDAEHAVALLDPPAGSVKAGAFGVIPTASLRAPKLVGTDAPVMEVAFAPAPTAEALITVRDDSRRRWGVHVVGLPSLQTDYVSLASPPIAAGIIPEVGKGYVAQEHAEGRITFIEFPTDLTDGAAATPQARTLTGFELAAKVTYPTGD